MSKIVPLRWQSETLKILDQLKLPKEESWLECKTAKEVASAIKDMNVRGAPAIGVAAAFGVVLGLKGQNAKEARRDFPSLKELLGSTRPTAVNLFWALERMEKRLFELPSTENGEALFKAMEREASAIRDEDEAHCLAIGKHGAKLIPLKSNVLTHCNAGALATAAYGTALGVIRHAFSEGRISMVYCDETRPYLQGARLSTWELVKEGIPCRLICDSMPAHLMAQSMIDAVVVGADRIAANGDVANKIGTYQLAVSCKHHGIPLYVAAPSSTIDLSLASGQEIEIEERSSEELTQIAGVSIAPEEVKALHPAFDVTPWELIGAIITEKGVIEAPFESGLREVFAC